MKIKICGFTNAQNANQAAMLGIDAIGLVFYDQSLRNVGVETALQIVNALPPFINRVGLFVNADSSFIDEVLCEVPLDTLQFHGDESAAECRQYATKRQNTKLRSRVDFLLLFFRWQQILFGDAHGKNH